MLKDIDLNKDLTKEECRMMLDSLYLEVGRLQREIKAAEIPVCVLFEGWGASGKGTLIRRLIQPLDPRDFKVFKIKTATKDEQMYPDFWRFWTKTPARGRMNIFDRSWYRMLTDGREKTAVEKQQIYDDILSFEEQLEKDDMVIIKCFLHISKKEQAKRLKKLEASADTAWRVDKADWQQNRAYEEQRSFYDDMLENTDTAVSPWNVIEATDREYAAVKLLTVVREGLEHALSLKKEYRESTDIRSEIQEDQALRTSILDGVDLSLAYTKEEYQDRIDSLQKKMEYLHNDMYLQRIPVVVAFEGWDAAGKGGAIKRMTSHLDPRGYEVVPVASPTAEEKAHHYLWRFWNRMPKRGHMTVFDRTWYGRVMVERIEGFCSEDEWRRAYREINQMETSLTNSGVIVLKFWLHIDKDEQEKRFNERMKDPDKQWKITEEDWRNREKWEAYKTAVDDMLLKTSTANAPWVVVPGNSKYYARVKVLETIVDALENRIKK